MIQVKAFHWATVNGQQAADKATAKANAWLRKHRSAKVISTTTSQNGYTYDGELGVEFTVTLTLDVPEQYLVDFEQEDGEPMQVYDPSSGQMIQAVRGPDEGPIIKQ